jgi:apurinic endonuclease APN1
LLGDAVSFDRVIYEGFAPHQVPVMIEVLTDNVNRSASEMRVLFRKGQQGTSGSVSWDFDHVGFIEAEPAQAGADAELAAANAAIQATGANLFIHSPYIINLCTQATAENEDYHTKLLIKNLQYGVAMGAKGVVVHVGKSTTQPLPEAMATMRSNILTAIEHATPSCPLLLETPAGQGTEVLRTWSEFAAFVADINDLRLRICIDTCHVFACGEDPETYLKRTLGAHPDVTKLIHFNDSATPCGSCLDRHAFVGQGHIGIEKMTAIAIAASASSLPMVIE